MAGMTAVDFDELAHGRLLLGVGGGNRIINEAWQGIAHARVLTKMREYVALLRIIARTPAGERIRYTGQVHRMDWTPRVTPVAPYPVYLAAIFPSMLRVAAEVADGIAGGATLSAPYLRDALRPAIAGHATRAGRDPEAFAWRAVMFTAASADSDAARRAVRGALCALFAPLPHPYYEHTMCEQGFGAVVARLRALVPAGRTAEAIDAIPDALVDRLAIAGTPAQCRARIAEYEGLLDELLLINALPPAAGGWRESYADFLTLVAARDASRTEAVSA
jgi:alkanesulfonate monooxygenase SsuD/methylene tetrahydromethanopterin reductase-like flavin-dependent oxidoreductase (luciferase family)